MKKILKKSAAALAALTLTAALAGCGSSASSAAASTDTAASTAETSGENELEKVKAAGKLVIGVEGTYPPFTYHDDNGELTGLDVELGKALPKSWASRSSSRRPPGTRCSLVLTPAALIRSSTASASPTSAPKNTTSPTPTTTKPAAWSCVPMMTASTAPRT